MVFPTAGLNLWCNVHMCGTCVRMCACAFVCHRVREHVRGYYRHHAQTLNAPLQVSQPSQTIKGKIPYTSGGLGFLPAPKEGVNASGT